jgi:hypothetical protein
MREGLMIFTGILLGIVVLGIAVLAIFTIVSAREKEDRAPKVALLVSFCSLLLPS